MKRVELESIYQEITVLKISSQWFYFFYFRHWGSWPSTWQWLYK